MAEIQWFYARGGEQMGPVSPAGLRQIAQAGEIAASDLVWREGMAEWAPAGTVKGLFPETKDKVAAANPPAAPAPAVTPAATPAALADSPVAATPPAMTPPAGTIAEVAAPVRAARSGSTIRVSQLVQLVLWLLCAAIVILAACQFTVATLRAESSPDRAAAAAIFSAYFVGAYVVARAGERLCTLVENWGKCS